MLIFNMGIISRCYEQRRVLTSEPDSLCVCPYFKTRQCCPSPYFLHIQFMPCNFIKTKQLTKQCFFLICNVSPGISRRYHASCQGRALKCVLGCGVCVCDLQHSVECYRLQDHSLLIQRLDGFTHTLVFRLIIYDCKKTD